MMMKLRIKGMVLLILVLGMAACGSPKEVKPNLWDRYKTPEINLQKWVGHYYRSGNIENNGGLVMNFFSMKKRESFLAICR